MYSPNPIHFTGSFGAALYLSPNSFANVYNQNWVYDGPTTFSDANVDSNGFCSLSGTTFTNAQNVTGKRYSLGNNCTITTNGSGASYIPGTIAGTEGQNSTYL